jgi:hypothetical protein
MGRTYEQVHTGEWLSYSRKNQRIRCCDCGLVHVYDFRVHKGKLEIRVFVDRRATGQIRRHAGIKITQKLKKKK